MNSTAKRASLLPFIGPITYYTPVIDGQVSAEGLSDELLQIVQAELNVVRGEFAGAKDFYAQVRKDGPYFLTAAGAAIFGAVGADDPQLFDAVLSDIAAFPERNGAPEAKLAAEIVMTWVRKHLVAPMGCPPWLEHLNLSSFPVEWRRQVAYLAVEYMRVKGEYKAAGILADALLSFDADKMAVASAADIYLKLAKTKICRDEGRMDEVEHWCRETVLSARPRQIVLPFLGVLMGPKSPIERVLSKEAPELLKKIRNLTDSYFRNRVKYHNRFTGDSVTEKLTSREFFLAQSLKRGMRYKEIAERLGVVQGRVHNLAGALYLKLGIKNAREIGGFVW